MQCRQEPSECCLAQRSKKEDACVAFDSLSKMRPRDSKTYHNSTLSSFNCVLGGVDVDPLWELRLRDLRKLPRLDPAVLVPACTPLSCCTCSLTFPIPALASVVCPANAVALIPLVHLCLRSTQPGRRGIRLCVSWESHGGAMYPLSPAMLENWSVKPSL